MFRVSGATSWSIFSKADRKPASLWALSHKTVFALMSWLIFAALMWGRWRHGWRGRLAVRWTLAGFVLLLLAYVGSKFVLEVLLHRMG